MHWEPREVKIANYTRGALAGLGLGLLYLLPDLAINAYRFNPSTYHGRVVWYSDITKSTVTAFGNRKKLTEQLQKREKILITYERNRVRVTEYTSNV